KGPCGFQMGPALGGNRSSSALSLSRLAWTRFSLASATFAGMKALASSAKMKMDLITRIRPKNLLEGTPWSLGLRPTLLAGSPEKLPHREKFHKGFFKKYSLPEA